MTKICISAFVLCLLCPVCFGQSWSTIPADVVINMNTSSPGTPLTGAIVQAGTTTSDMTFSSIDIGNGFTVGANQPACSNLGPVLLNGGLGTLLPALLENYNTIAISDAVTLQNVTLNVSGAASGSHVMSAAICIFIGPPSTAGSGSDWDRFGLWAGGAGEYAMLQMAQSGGCTTQSAPSGYICVRMEGKPTSHSGYFFVQPQHAYWFTFYWNDSTGTVDGAPAGTMYLHVYNTDGTPIACGTSSGCTTLAANGNIAADIIPNQTATLTAGDKGGGLIHLTIGNNENGNSSGGTTTYYQNAMFNYTTGAFPLFWASGTTGTQPQPPTNIKATAQ